ncbi:DUF3613 domain-containing protein [Solimonas soli]|uniref:DUF3613 domain-containing protein n=1 Tax=Solimonas soli TaxID=413479 RepID=UPI00047FEA6E|nr:DUF3613 domain-containing protein [Solimonas soli]
MKKSMLIGAMLLAAAPAYAGETQAAPLPRLGADTQAWLALQTDPAAQAADVRPVPGEVAERVYQRYVDSFKFPIPEHFQRDSFVQGGGSGGGGSR